MWRAMWKITEHEQKIIKRICVWRLGNVDPRYIGQPRERNWTDGRMD